MFKKINLLVILAVAFVIGGIFLWEGFGMASLNNSVLAQESGQTSTMTTTSSIETNIVSQKGTLQVTTETPDAKNIEYYSQSTQSGTKTYLGTAANKSPNTWQLNIDSAKRLPNGEYRVAPRVQQKDGAIVNGKSIGIVIEEQKETLSPLERAKFENSQSDTDEDSISDKEEVRLGTNPKLADSDKDGFLDGDEIKTGFDPLKFSSGDKSDKITFESPKEIIASPETGKRTVDDDRFTVNAVTVVDTPTAGDAHKKAARFSGKALPNIFITLYIYSDPIIVTVKTDAEGNWTYDLDKELPDGDHEVYVAVTDNVGKITSQSRALPFVKTADAITVKPISAAAAEAKNNASPLERSQTELIIIAAVIIVSFIGIALVLIGRRSSFIR